MLKKLLLFFLSLATVLFAGTFVKNLFTSYDPATITANVSAIYNPGVCSIMDDYQNYDIPICINKESGKTYFCDKIYSNSYKGTAGSSKEITTDIVNKPIHYYRTNYCLNNLNDTYVVKNSKRVISQEYNEALLKLKGKYILYVSYESGVDYDFAAMCRKYGAIGYVLTSDKHINDKDETPYNDINIIEDIIIVKDIKNRTVNSAIDSDTINASIDAVEKYMAEKNITFGGILTFDEYSVELEAGLREHFGLPGVSLKLAKTIRSKNSMRQAITDMGYENVVFYSVKLESLQDINKLTKSDIDKLGSLFVGKPCSGAGGEGVKKITSYDDYVTYAKNMIAKNVSTCFVFETFIDYKIEVDVNIVMQDNRVIFETVTDNFDNNGCILEIGGYVQSLYLNKKEKK